MRITKTTFKDVFLNDVNGSILKVEKYVDKKCASVFDILTYTVTVTNTSRYKTGNIFFKDYISKYIGFINNTVKVNGIIKRGLNPQQGFYIGRIDASCKKVVSFKSVVLPNSAHRIIKNSANIYYYYKCNLDKFPTRISVESNRVYTNVNKIVFKQLNISNTLKAPKNLRDILKVNVNSKIFDVKPMKNLINKGSNLKLCNLIVFGCVEVEIDYSCKKRSNFKTANKANDIQKDKYYKNDIQNNNENINDCKKQISFGDNKVKKITKTFGFSCFICSPVGIIYEDMKNINIKIEHTSINELNPEELFVNTSLLLYY